MNDSFLAGQNFGTGYLETEREEDPDNYGEGHHSP
jgi:hypothetical protein